MASIKELGKKAEALIEKGDEAGQEVSNAQANVAVSQSRVSAARRQLAAASETDEEGNPVGDVSAARAQLSMAENQLAASERALSSAQQKVKQIKSEKNSLVSDLEGHSEVAKSNIEKLRRLSDLAFGENAAGAIEGIASRHDEAEDAKAALLKSMGMEASVDHISGSAGGGSGSASWGGGIGGHSLDISGTPQSIRGGGGGGAEGTAGAAGKGIAAPVGGALGAFGNAMSRVLGKGRGNTDSSSAPSSGRTFGSFETDRHINGSDYFVKGDNYDRFKRNYYSADNSVYERYDTPVERTISPGSIEGIHLGEPEMENPDVFWSQHESGGTAESFREIAARIPEVRARLASGESLDSLVQDPELSRCAGIYFRDRPRVVESDGYYEFDSNGRHRILAARELGYDIPVDVIGRRVYNPTSDYP